MKGTMVPGSIRNGGGLLDEIFDVGVDTGTPVLEKYLDKMPFRFTGTLK